LNSGQFFGGFIDLPLFEPSRLHGKIAYEISVGMSQSQTTFQTTSNVAQVANLAVLTALNPNGGLRNGRPRRCKGNSPRSGCGWN